MYEENYRSPLVSHLVELRKRMLVAFAVILACFGICFYFKEQLFTLLVLPLTGTQGEGAQMIFTGVAELFFTYLKMSFLAGLYIGLPLLLLEVWKFIAPGLYDHERKVVLPFVIATPVLFYVGGLFTYFLVMPVAIEFFFKFQNDLITALPSVKEYLTFFSKMVFAFGIAFELPVLLLVLMKFGVVSLASVFNFRRYAVLCTFVIAAILTPPDPLSQLMLAVPLILLYELSILTAKLMGIGKDVEPQTSSAI